MGSDRTVAAQSKHAKRASIHRTCLVLTAPRRVPRPHANWLVVRGDVKTIGDPEWTFVDPCLTTWEVSQVTAWLRGVIDGAVRPTAEWSNEADLLHFTEPSIALSLQERTEARARIRIHLSLEALPPHLRGHDQPDIFAYFLVVDASIESIAAAADEWNEECRAFPVR